MGWALRLALAYALLLQMVLASAAAVQHAAAAAPNPWNATCAGLASPKGEAPAKAPHRDLCCMLGCLASPLPPLAPGGEAARLKPAPRVTAIVFAERPAAGAAHPASHPFHARGPPRAV